MCSMITPQPSVQWGRPPERHRQLRPGRWFFWVWLQATPAQRSAFRKLALFKEFLGEG